MKKGVILKAEISMDANSFREISDFANVRRRRICVAVSSREVYHIFWIFKLHTAWENFFAYSNGNKQ